MNNFVICLAELNQERINYYYFFLKIVVIKELHHRNELEHRRIMVEVEKLKKMFLKRIKC